MRCLLGLAACLVMLGCNKVPDQKEATSQNEATPQNEVRAEEPQLAAEGRDLLPPPAEMPATLGGAPPEHPFVRDPSGGFSQTLFETDEDPNFKLIIRDFSFPPDRQKHTVTLPSGAFLHTLGGQGEISIGYQRLGLTAEARRAVPAGAPLEVVNNGEQPMVVRALIVEAK